MKEELFSSKEIQVLLKFIKAGIVVEEDEQTLYKYGGIGFVCFGFNWDTMVETAILTELGFEHLIRQILYSDK